MIAWIGELRLDKWYHLGFLIPFSQVRAWGDLSRERETCRAPMPASRAQRSWAADKGVSGLPSESRSNPVFLFTDRGTKEKMPACELSFWIGWAGHSSWFLSPAAQQSEVSQGGESEFVEGQKLPSQGWPATEVLLGDRRRMLGGKISLPPSTDFWSLSIWGLTIKFLLPMSRKPTSHFLRQEPQFITSPLASWDPEQLV